jgi:hypothetical protein
MENLGNLFGELIDKYQLSDKKITKTFLRKCYSVLNEDFF